MKIQSRKGSPVLSGSCEHAGTGGAAGNQRTESPMKRHILTLAAILSMLALPWAARAQGTSFTYQGLLTDGEAPANGLYDLEFTLFVAESGGYQAAAPNLIEDVGVSNGLFTVMLDFGAGPFDGGERWIQIGVRPGSGEDAFSLLEPRQKVMSSPYAIHAGSVCAAGIQGTIPAANLGTITAANLAEGSVGSAQIAANSVGAVQLIQNSVVVEALATNIGVWEKSGTQVTYSGGNVGIGKKDPAAELDVNGTVRAAAFTGDGSGLTNLPANTSGMLVNPMQAALLKWYVGNKTFAAGSGACDLAFDGSCIWVANRGENTVTKLRASDGGVVGTYAVGRLPLSVTFDGEHVWVVNYTDNSVSKLRASDGTTVGTYAVGRCPRMAAFDGANIWVGNSSDNTVTQLRASDAANLGTYPVGVSPHGIAFDGEHVWVANLYGATVTKLRASDGASIGTFPVGNRPMGVAFDGANIWVASSGDGVVTKLRASDGETLGAYAVGSSAYDVAFDGLHVWVSSHMDGTVTKLRASDGGYANGTAEKSTYGGFRTPYGMAFDGANIWVVNGANSTVGKL